MSKEVLFAAARLATRRHLRAIAEVDRLTEALRIAETERLEACNAQREAMIDIEIALESEAEEDV